VATSHGWTGNGFVERFIYYPGDRRVLRSFDRVIAVSDDIRDKLLRSGVSSNKVSVLLNGIDPNKYIASPQVRESARRELGLAEHDVVLGAVGRLERQKRFDLMLVAFRSIRERIPHARLLIAGEGSLKSAIQSQINQLGLTDYCRLLGHCDNVRDIFQSFDVLVQSSDYEGTPTVVVEAMALGIPIVATDAGGTAQLAFPDQHALIVPCGDTNALANAVMEVLSDSDATLRRTTLARERAETELTFEHRVEQLTKIYEGLAKTS
jgi:glycosyltransferase involved in cell wall biosynthesis